MILTCLGFAAFIGPVHGQSTRTVPRTQSSNNGPSTRADSSKTESDSDGDKYALQPGEDPENKLVSPFIKHIIRDQEQFWTTPARMKLKDLRLVAPFAAATAGLIEGDSWISKQIPNKPNQLTRSLHISDYSVYSLIALGGGSFLVGELTHNDHLSDTGLLSGEAAINATGVTYLLKELTQRQRPNAGDGNGRFFQGGQSFTSEHAALAWSVASVWAHEYPGTLSQILAYGLASTVTLTRVTSQQHFASDVVVGSALGWYFGRQVYRAHHDTELGGASWGEVLDQDEPSEHARNPNNMGSPYVPLDSWIYPAIEHLTALGYINSAYLGMRPWTRMECANLIAEARDLMTDDAVDGSSESEGLYAALETEFRPETSRLDGATNLGADVDTIYTRFTGISGKPLRDGYHFGQTIINDYGRPYSEGVNNITGFTSHAVAGPFAISIHGEYQDAPSLASDPLNVLQATAAADFTPPLANGRLAIDRFRLLDSAVSFKLGDVEFSFGNQSDWLGPSEAGSLLMSNNAEPFPMFKIDTPSAYEIPLLSHFLGPARVQYFIGMLSGQKWEECDLASCRSYPGYPGVVGPSISPQPFIHGEKISFKPTANFEFGMGVTAMFGGPGLPVTLRNYFRTYYAHSATATNNPGKRISSFDLSYRIPGVHGLTLYADSLVVDEISPIGSARPTVNAGLLIPQVPGIPKLELRVEGIRTTHTTEFPPGFTYFDQRRFRSGYTNNGNLMGNWIGRDGQGGQAWLTYWLSARNKIQFDYRNQESEKNFVSGGHLNNYGMCGEFMLSHNISLMGDVHYEEWRFPVLSTANQHDFTAIGQLTFYPHLGFKR